MKLHLSAKNDPRGKHLVLSMDRGESFNAYDVIYDEVLQGRKYPFKEEAGAIVIYRFHLNYLERLMLVFPQAELSEAIDGLIVSREKKKLKDTPVPDIEIPGFYDYLDEHPAHPYGFQKISIDIAERHIEEMMLDCQEGVVPAFFLNHEMGLGKTIISQGIAQRKRWYSALCITPNSGKWSTAKIIDRYFDDDFTYQVVDGTKDKRTQQILSDADMTIVNVEALRMKREYNRSTREWSEEAAHPELFWNEDGSRRVWDFVIVDEHHRFKNPDNQQTKGFLALLAHRWLFMSGTPIMNRVEEIWPVLHKCDPERFPTLYAFQQEFCIFGKTGSIIGYKPDKMIWLREYLHARSLRYRAEHVSDELPKIVPITREIELTTEQRKLYRKILEEGLLELEDGSNRKVINALSLITRLKQACFSPELYGGSKKSTKIEEMRADIEQLVAAGQKAIVFSQWSTATKILQREFAQYNPAYVDGKVKGSKRDVQVEMFNNDEDCKLYIGTIKANQEAITLGAATWVLFADLWWTPLANDQAFARSAGGGLRGAHLGSTGQVFRVEYHAKDTIEDKIAAMLRTKKNVFNNLVERDGGVRLRGAVTKTLRDLLFEEAA